MMWASRDRRPRIRSVPERLDHLVHPEAVQRSRSRVKNYRGMPAQSGFELFRSVKALYTSLESHLMTPTFRLSWMP